MATTYAFIPRRTFEDADLSVDALIGRLARWLYPRFGPYVTLSVEEDDGTTFEPTDVPLIIWLHVEEDSIWRHLDPEDFAKREGFSINEVEQQFPELRFTVL